MSHTFPMLVPNYPPPPFAPQNQSTAINSDAAVSKLATKSHLYSQRLQNYLNSRKNRTNKIPFKEKSKKGLKLSDVSNELSNSFDMIQTINAEVKELSENLSTFTDHQWNHRISALNSETYDLAKICLKYQDNQLRSDVQNSIKKRHNKRERIKKRKAETKVLKVFEAKQRARKHQEIDKWLEKNEKKIMENRQKDETKQQAQELLANIQNHKSEAEKFLLIFDSLKELHRLRNRDRVSNVENDTKFKHELEQLKQMWLDASQKYAAEEKGLRIFLDYSNNWEEWGDVLFGEPTIEEALFTLKKKENGLNQLIEIRKLWDSCIVPPENQFGSSVPHFWAIPSANPTHKWKAYMKNT